MKTCWPAPSRIAQAMIWPDVSSAASPGTTWPWISSSPSTADSAPVGSLSSPSTTGTENGIAVPRSRRSPVTAAIAAPSIPDELEDRDVRALRSGPGGADLPAFGLEADRQQLGIRSPDEREAGGGQRQHDRGDDDGVAEAPDPRELAARLGVGLAEGGYDDRALTLVDVSAVPADHGLRGLALRVVPGQVLRQPGLHVGQLAAQCAAARELEQRLLGGAQVGVHPRDVGAGGARAHAGVGPRRRPAPPRGAGRCSAPARLPCARRARWSRPPASRGGSSTRFA